MLALAAHRVEKHFGDRILFHDITFDIGDRDKIGLVGDNGTGKTTLFRMIIGESSLDGGEIVRSRETRIGYMEQHVCTGNRSLTDEVEDIFAPLKRMEHELREINNRLAGSESGDARLIEQQHLLQEKFESAGGLYFRNRVRSALLGLGFTQAALEQPVSSLSGGQRSKAAMARLLLSNANLLLLDEPTNHLDIQSVEWLEEFLRAYNGAVVVISHDRYFLDRVTNRTLELANGALYATNGNYSAHKENRERNREIQLKHYKTASREIQRIEENIALLRQWNREKSIRTAESKQKMVDRLKEQLETPEKEQEMIRFDFTSSITSGNEVIHAENLQMGFGDHELFRGVNLDIRRGERVFLLGPNGCGKTTLLKILCGQLKPQNGFIKLGAKVTIGYYDQTQSGLDPNKTAIDAIWDCYPDLTQTQLRNAMAAFLFHGDDVFRPISLLSGGERARLLLLKLMLARDNLLLLDEPTNHLDIASREALEQALSGYDGTIFIVSHDRYFINRMADKVLYLSENGCKAYVGDYDEFLEKHRQTTVTVQEKVPKENAYRIRKEQESARRRLVSHIRRLEEQITAVEKSIAVCHAQLEAEASDYTRIIEISSELEKKNQELNQLMSEWEESLIKAEEMGGTPE